MSNIFESLISRLSQYTREKNLSKCKTLHSQIIKSGTSSCLYIANCLVNCYAKCHRLPEALLAFDEIENKDVVSWNCLINGYSQVGGSNSSDSVMGLFKSLRDDNGLFPNPHTFTGVFTAASNLGDPFAGEQAHSLALKMALCTDVFVGSSLLNMYCKTGLVCEARKVFDRMPESNSVSWATMISGYAMQRMAMEALGVFRLMINRGEEIINEFVLTSMLSALTLPELTKIGKLIHCVVIKNGLLSVVSVENAIVTMYAKCNNLDDSFHAFEFSNNKNAITWSAMITGYAQSGDGEKALKLFSKMHFSGTKSSEFTLVGVLNSCSDTGFVEQGKQVHGLLIKSGYESHMYIMTALVDMYAKCSNITDARKGFDLLQEPDLVLWTSMIGGYVQNGENEEAMILYCRMQMEQIVPNELTIVSILKACSTLVAFDQGKQIHSHIVKFGFTLEAPIGNALSTMYAKCGSLEDGEIVFRRMPKRDVVSWNSMISGLSQNGQGEEALKLFEEMRKDGITPDYITFVNVLSACSHMGLVEKGWDYFNMISNEFGLIQGVDHYACMVDILGRAGKLNEAKEFIESASIDHGLCLWRILLSACRNYRNYELGAYSGEKLLELGAKDSSVYVLLSGIYSILGRFKDVERVRRAMSVRGVSKEPGCSWIEIKSQIHVFVVGDVKHPEIEEICLELRRISKVMKHADDDDFDSDLEDFFMADEIKR